MFFLRLFFVMILSWFIIILNNNIIIFFNHFTHADFLNFSHCRNPLIAEVRLFIKVKLFSSVVCIFFFFLDYEPFSSFNTPLPHLPSYGNCMSCSWQKCWRIVGRFHLYLTCSTWSYANFLAWGFLHFINHVNADSVCLCFGGMDLIFSW